MLALNCKESPTRDPDIEASIKFISTKNGGRSTPAFSGYRPDHNFGIDGILNGAQHEYLNADRLEPGESGLALLWFLIPEDQNGKLFVGKEFTVQEANRIVGSGKITKVINNNLNKNS